MYIAIYRRSTNVHYFWFPNFSPKQLCMKQESQVLAGFEIVNSTQRKSQKELEVNNL